MELDLKDRIALSLTPFLPVPRHTPLEPLQPGGVRYLIAAGGMYVEARSRALHVCLPLARWQGRLPLGEAKPFAMPSAGPIPEAMLRRFMAQSSAASPCETAALIVLRQGGYELIQPENQQANPERVSYSVRGIDPLDVLVDMHSHGADRAYFSPTDDQDDLANPSPCFFAMVFGKAASRQPQIEARTVANGWASLGIHDLAKHLDSTSWPRPEWPWDSRHFGVQA